MGIPLLFAEEFELVIMIAVGIEEMHGSDRVPDLKRLQASLGLAWHFFIERKGALFGVHGLVRSIECLTLPTLSETPVNDSYARSALIRISSCP